MKRTEQQCVKLKFLMPATSRINLSQASIFKNATNTRIKDSSFTIINNNNNNIIQSLGDGIADPLKTLYDRVAPNAILNAGGRADEVKCYPGTREEVIDLTERWMEGKDGVAHGMMWLSGPAGAGKSAIVQTIAERCEERGVQAASFFFFRSDPTRSTAQPLVATLLYQIFKIYPPVRQAVASALSDDPLLFDASIQDQFNRLLSPALNDIPQPLESPTRRPVVLLIDGLDECDSEHKSSQRQILQALDYLLMQNNCPFLVLVASRADPQITMAVKELASPVKSIFLDEQYQPEGDIRAFVTGEFARIKKSHHLAHMLSDHWPSDEDTESIVNVHFCGHGYALHCKLIGKPKAQFGKGARHSSTCHHKLTVCAFGCHLQVHPFSSEKSGGNHGPSLNGATICHPCP
ncbi:hypothetical protein D9619_009216 [Psilocybe cf. subviscida]|uniref:NACHT domain-containing protein n=1 Tax=Psilocybe cf. subviscida TaxID=2480587 RepID=A0A8H5BUB5_9AGAR|nr:hypothetical protein D9619_009216 [Psilocybe cf. subviscida]